MKVWQTLTRHHAPRRAAWVICALILALAPLPLVGQAPAAKPVVAAPVAQAPAAKDTAPLSWADKILQQESYATPPQELAAAVTAPRQQNVTLGNLSPDKKWFLNQVGDGPVVMATFSKPFHELGGLFVDFKANRARPLTVNNGVGLQIVSAADGTRKTLATPPNARVSNAAWSPDGSAVAYFVHTEDATQHLDDRRGDQHAASDHAAAGAGHAGDDVRLHEGRQADRHRAGPREPARDARSHPPLRPGPR